MSVKFRKNKYPGAYKRGWQDFYGRKFIVEEGKVLIPRPETEQIIDAVLDLAGVAYLPGVKPSRRRLPIYPVIWDIGTGSGCIAITLAKELPKARILATDVSVEVLKVAQKNARFHNVNNVDFQLAYLLNDVKNDCDCGAPDVIVANLPYVDKNWGWLDREALAFEPEGALYAEDHGLALIKELIDTADSQYLILEADPSQHDAIIEYAKNQYKLVKMMGFVLIFRHYSL